MELARVLEPRAHRCWRISELGVFNRCGGNEICRGAPIEPGVRAIIEVQASLLAARSSGRQADCRCSGEEAFVVADERGQLAAENRVPGCEMDRV
jgi:hypothetical protein